jgi:hypothetical protein
MGKSATPKTPTTVKASAAVPATTVPATTVPTAAVPRGRDFGSQHEQGRCAKR